jgi:hypothetical protein
MIEAPAFNLDIPFRFNMAGGATSNRTGDTFFFPCQACTIKMADDTIGLMNGEM